MRPTLQCDARQIAHIAQINDQLLGEIGVLGRPRSTSFKGVVGVLGIEYFVYYVEQSLDLDSSSCCRFKMYVEIQVIELFPK